MQKFQLCYELPDQRDRFIAPQLLHESPADYDWSEEDNLQLRYHYPVFMPRGILSRAIVRLRRRIENQALVWRSGVILCDDFARAEILELRGERQLRIRIAGQNKRDLMMEIVRALDELHRSFPKLRYERQIPCHCEACRSGSVPHFYVLDELLQRLANGKDTIECKNPPYENVVVRGLLDEVVVIKREAQMLETLEPKYAYIHYGDIINEGGKYMYEGDEIQVERIEDSQSVSIGEGARASGSMVAVTQPQILAENPTRGPRISVNSAWANGLFYLLVFVVVIASLGVLANSVTPWTLVIIIVAGVLFIPLIGALQLRQDERLTQKNFLELVGLVIKQLPLVGRLFPKG
jgi:hypothetical protein